MIEIKAEIQNVCKQLKSLNGKTQRGPTHQIFPSVTHGDPSQCDSAYFMMRTALTSQTAAGVNLFARVPTAGQINPACEIGKEMYLRQSKRPKGLLLSQVKRKAHEGPRKDLVNQ